MARLTFGSVAGHWQCGADYTHVSITRIEGPDDWVCFAYVCNVQVDFDGAADAYGPSGTRHRDSIKNARDTPDPKRKGWYGVVSMTPADAASHGVAIDATPDLKDCFGRFPVIQGSGQPRPGLYVSKGSIPANGLHPWDQRHWVDATEVAFGALSGKLANEGFALGDMCLSFCPDKGKRTTYPFMDMGGAHSSKLSELSYKAFIDLGGSGFTSHEAARHNNFICCHLAFQESDGWDPADILAALSKADNAADLPLFLACQLAAGPNGDGLRLFRTQAAATPEMRVRSRMALPVDYHAVVAQLRGAGYVYMDYGDFTATLTGRA